jgi:hypothetical protein
MPTAFLKTPNSLLGNDQLPLLKNKKICHLPAAFFSASAKSFEKAGGFRCLRKKGLAFFADLKKISPSGAYLFPKIKRRPSSSGTPLSTRVPHIVGQHHRLSS